jgi:hypothetical protein
MSIFIHTFEVFINKGKEERCHISRISGMLKKRTDMRENCGEM